MGKSFLNGMSPTERLSYSHGRVARSMQDFRQQIYSMHKLAQFERNLLLILAVVFSVIILAAFYFLEPIGILEFLLLGIIAAMFSAGGLVAYNATRRNLAMLDGLEFLYSKLADDQTMKFVTETMKMENDEIKRIHLTGLTDAKLRDALMLAGHVIDAIVSRIESEGKANDPTGTGGQSEGGAERAS